PLRLVGSSAAGFTEDPAIQKWVKRFLWEGLSVEHIIEAKSPVAPGEPVRGEPRRLGGGMEGDRRSDSPRRMDALLDSGHHGSWCRSLGRGGSGGGVSTPPDPP